MAQCSVCGDETELFLGGVPLCLKCDSSKPASRNATANILEDEVARARKAYEAAHEAFKLVTAGIPSGIPSPDGTERIVNAGKTYRATMDAYSRALREYNDFILTGTVPEGLNVRRQAKLSHVPDRI